MITQNRRPNKPPVCIKVFLKLSEIRSFSVCYELSSLLLGKTCCAVNIALIIYKVDVFTILDVTKSKVTYGNKQVLITVIGGSVLYGVSCEYF